MLHQKKGAFPLVSHVITVRVSNVILGIKLGRGGGERRGEGRGGEETTVCYSRLI